jgi:cob(I)alamin adenosyltransferase
LQFQLLMHCCTCYRCAMRKSQLYVVTGNGKGKTTAALGYALREVLKGHQATVIQFLKGGGYTGELFSTPAFGKLFTIKQFGYGCPIAAEIRSGRQKCTKCGLCFRENRKIEHAFAPKALACAWQEVTSGANRVVVLDEISHVLNHKLIDLAEVLRLVTSRSEGTDLVLTGRKMPVELIGLATIATCCEAVEHPLTSKGIDARRGIEY